MLEKHMVKNRDFLVTETEIDTKIDPTVIVNFLKEKDATGHVVFHLSQGSLQSIVVTERTKISEPKRDEVRQSLGME